MSFISAIIINTSCGENDGDLIPLVQFKGGVNGDSYNCIWV